MKRRRFLQGTGLAAASTLAWLAPRPARAAQAKQRIKVGQIGVGHAHASGKMAGFRKLADEYEVVGIVEPDPKLRAAWENHPIYRGLTWMTEEQLLQTKGLQAVAVETAVGGLVPTATRCVAAGMHLHLDKPGGESIRAFRGMLDDARRQHLAVQMGYMFRNNPAFQFCFRAVREGWLGQVFELHGVMGKMLPPAARRPLLPYRGGTMFELGCHLIDPLVAVLGRPEKVTPYNRRTRPQTDDLYDNQLAVFEYPKATATIRASVVEVDGESRRQFVICGDEGTLDIRPLEPPKLRLALARPRPGFRSGYQEVELPPMPGRYDDQLRELAQIIRGEKEHPYPPEHDLAVQEAVLLASGRPLEPH
jgi:predicted dehydrogenase